MPFRITTSAQANNYLALLTKLRNILDSGVEMFVDLRTLDAHFKQSRIFDTTVADAILVIEKAFYVWQTDISATFHDVEALALSFTDAELVGFK